ncbi:MAG: lysylphosphatidylglycerol synthase transmembrane domain-containing protein [Anaerolineales bacterium]|nr:lysylphosphatidylglycerol synthase transmembrane domain-containing protein [Anaerolineales bacterium]
MPAGDRHSASGQPKASDVGVGGARQPNWQVWVGAAISLGCLYLAFRGVQLEPLLAQLGRASASWLLLSLGVSLATLLAKAARWRALFAPPRLPNRGRAFAIQSIGMLFNLYMPARLGDLARAYLMGESEGMSKTYVLGTIVLEKFFDLAMLLISVGLLVTQLAIPVWLIGPSETTALLLGGVVLALVVLTLRPDPALKLVERASVLIPADGRGWVRRQTQNALASLQVLRSPVHTLRIVLWTLLIWTLGFVTNYLVFLAVGFALPIWAAIFLLAVLQIGIAVPSSPGRIGVFHYLTVLSLDFFAIDHQAGQGYSLALYAVAILPPTLAGAYFVWREKITWSKLQAAAERLRRPAGTDEGGAR